jgi:hypothetical protein
MKFQNRLGKLDKGQATTWGGLATVLESLKEEVLVSEKGGPIDGHTTYLVGDDYAMDPDKNILVEVLSSRNLLLNAYRQTQFGQPTSLYVDSSYVLLLEWNANAERRGNSQFESHDNTVTFFVEFGTVDVVFRLVDERLVASRYVTNVFGLLENKLSSQ